MADRPGVGAVETAYFVFLAQAYRVGDLSVVYPIARGTAPLIAVAIGVLILGERLAPVAWLGVVLLLAGVLVVQRPWRMLGPGGAAPAGAGFALLTGAMIATTRRSTGSASSWCRRGCTRRSCGRPWRSGWWRSTGCGRGGGGPRRPGAGAGGVAVEVVDPPVDRPRAIVGGLLTFAAYGFVLAALARAPLAIVAPLRESAVVLTSLWGVLRLGEAADRREVTLRIGGSVLVLAGAVVLAVGR